MKKSQIVAILALAFALGAIAPVANTASALTMPVYDSDSRVQAGTATDGEVRNAIAYVESDETYEAVKKIYDTYEWYKETCEASGANSCDYDQSLASAIVTAANNAHLGVWTGNPSTGSAEDAYKIIEDVISDADYKAYKDLYRAVQSNDKQTLIGAIDAFNTYLASISAPVLTIDTTDDGYGGEAETFQSLLTELDTQVQARGRTTDWVKGVDDAITAMRGNLGKYEEAMNYLQNAIPEDVFKSTALASWKAATQPSDLADLLATNGTVVTGTSFNIARFASWRNMIGKLNSTAASIENGTTEGNYTLINDLAEAYKAARGNTNMGNTTALIQVMAGYQSGTNPDRPNEGDDPTLSPDDSNQDADDAGKGAEGNGDEKAPAAGIFAGQTSASKAAGVVAAVSAALSSVGAGVVAIRRKLNLKK